MDIILYNKPPKNKLTMNIVSLFPENKSFALSSVGYLWLYSLMDKLPYVNINMLTIDSEKNKVNIALVDLIAVSMSFDFDFINVLKILDDYKIDFKAKNRSESDPLIFAGGPVITANPEPYSEIFDFLIIGDGETVNLKVINLINENKECLKDDILFKLSQIEGVYVPKFLKGNVIKVTDKLKKCLYSPIISDDAFFKNTLIIEVERGCANMCSFCLASFINLPIRFPDISDIKEIIDFSLLYTNKIALLGAQVTAHPKFLEICHYIDKLIDDGKNIEVSVSSLRVDAFTEDVVSTLVKAGQRNLTLAIEAGSERLRKVINKNLTESQIFNAIEVAIKCGLKGIKFYGIIGLPTETQQDIIEIINLSKRLKSKFKGFNISFGFSTFVPKAHTPFQWYGRENEIILNKKISYLKKEFAKLGIKASFSSIKWDFYQAVLSRGDSTLTDYLIEVYKQGGKIGAFKHAAKNLSINLDFYATQNYPFDMQLPWHFIKMLPGNEFLMNKATALLNEYTH